MFCRKWKRIELDYSLFFAGLRSTTNSFWVNLPALRSRCIQSVPAADGTTLRCLLKGWRGDVSNWQAFVAPVNHSLKIGKKSRSQLASAVLTLGVTCFQHFCIDKSQERKRGVFSWVEITNMQCHIPSVCSLLSAGLAALCTVQWKITIEWEIAGFVALLIKQDSRLIRKNVTGMGVEPLGKRERWWLHLKC